MDHVNEEIERLRRERAESVARQEAQHQQSLGERAELKKLTTKFMEWAHRSQIKPIVVGHDVETKELPPTSLGRLFGAKGSSVPVRKPIYGWKLQEVDTGTCGCTSRCECGSPDGEWYAWAIGIDGEVKAHRYRGSSRAAPQNPREVGWLIAKFVMHATATVPTTVPWPD